MSSVWGGLNNSESFDITLSADRTTGVITNPVPNPTGTVIGLDLLAASGRTTGALNNKVFHIANTVACHMNFGDGSVTATAADMLLMPGERLMVLPNQYVAVIKSAGSADGILRLTECV
jgi:myosin-crossreactive antigen